MPGLLGRLRLVIPLLAAAVLLTVAVSVNARLKSRIPIARTSSSVAFHMSSSPLMSAGGLTEKAEDELNHLNGYLAAATLSTGAIVVIDDSRVRLYSNHGSLVWTTGRRGQGPGEFSLLGRVCVTRGDTIVVQDIKTLRVTVLTDKGSVVRSFLPPRMSTLFSQSCFVDGSFLTSATGTSAGMRSVLRVRLDGKLLGVVGSFRPGDPGVRGAAQTSVAAAGRHFIVADPETNTISVLDTSGRHVRSITTADKADTKGLSSAKAGVDVAGRGAAPIMGSLPRGSHWPFFGDVKLSATGEVWVQRYRRDHEDKEVWYAHRTEGSIEGKVEISVQAASTRPLIMEIDRNSVLVLTRDNDGAACFSRYRLQKLR